LEALVTGASGLIGRACLRAAENRFGSSCHTWQRSEHGDFLSELSRQRVLDQVRPQLVIHAAWLNTSRPHYRDDLSNWAWAEASWDFTCAAVERGAHVILFGSARELWLDDHSPYAASKRALLSQAETWADQGSVTWIRPFWIYDLELLRPPFLRDLTVAKDWSQAGIRQPHQELDFLSLMDAAKALQLCVGSKVTGGVVEIGSGELRSLRDFVNALIPEVICPADSASSTVSRPDLRPADIRRLLHVGWAPSNTLTELQPKKR
jgi:nucleoside-diphosphate-sugar epimerase